MRPPTQLDEALEIESFLHTPPPFRSIEFELRTGTPVPIQVLGPGAALLVIRRPGSPSGGSQSGAGDRLQSSFEPRRKCIVTQLAARHVRHGVGDIQILHRQPIAASDSQQLHEIEGRALVPVHEAVIGNDAVDQSGRLLVNALVVTVVGARDRRLDRRTVENSGGAACQ